MSNKCGECEYFNPEKCEIIVLWDGKDFPDIYLYRCENAFLNCPGEPFVYTEKHKEACKFFKLKPPPLPKKCECCGQLVKGD